MKTWLISTILLLLTAACGVGKQPGIAEPADAYLADPMYIDAPGGPRDVRAGDFDEDGHLDLAATLYNADRVALWRGDGSGNFELAEQFASRGPLPHKLQSLSIMFN